MSRKRENSSYCFWICFVVLLVLTIVRTSQSQVIGRGGKVINCQKYVYAPPCRGIAAKRSIDPYPLQPPNPFYDINMADFNNWNSEYKNTLPNRKNLFLIAIPINYDDLQAGKKGLF